MEPSLKGALSRQAPVNPEVITAFLITMTSILRPETISLLPQKPDNYSNYLVIQHGSILLIESYLCC